MNDPIITQREAIILDGVFHRDAHRIAIRFVFESSKQAALKKAGAVYSSTHKCWLLPLQQTAWQTILQIFSANATIDRSALNSYMRALPQKVGPGKMAAEPPETKPAGISSAKAKPEAKPTAGIQQVNAGVLPAMRQTLILKGYSPNTQRTYLGEMAAFLQALKNTSADSFTVKRIKDYLAYCLTQLQLSENTLHSRMNALKFYYEQVLGREKFFWEIPRPKKHLQLPKVISTEKIFEGLLAVENLKHRLLLLVAYSAGLRVSEAVSLKLTSIDRDRMQLFIEKGKGKKDRVIPMAKAIIPILDEYLKTYKPDIWLFEGQHAGECYSTRSAQIVFKDAYRTLGLPANLSFHSLRHSYATHLLENGTDIKYIQELLGHNDIKTTLRYTHVSQRDLDKIENPLDAIMRRRSEK